MHYINYIRKYIKYVCAWVCVSYMCANAFQTLALDYFLDISLLLFHFPLPSLAFSCYCTFKCIFVKIVVIFAALKVSLISG